MIVSTLLRRDREIGQWCSRTSTHAFRSVRWLLRSLMHGLHTGYSRSYLPDSRFLDRSFINYASVRVLWSKRHSSSSFCVSFLFQALLKTSDENEISEEKNCWRIVKVPSGRGQLKENNPDNERITMKYTIGSTWLIIILQLTIIEAFEYKTSTVSHNW